MHNTSIIKLLIAIVFSFSLCISQTFAIDVPISLFPIKNYDQNIDHFLKPSDSNYHTRLLSKDYQMRRFQEFYQHTFSTDQDAKSPWSEGYVTRVIHQTPDLASIENGLLNTYDNTGKSGKNIGYGENFRPYLSQWIQKIRENMNIRQFTPAFQFSPQQRGIMVRNANVRMIPTSDPYYYHFTLPGEGYPFDMLQASSIWVGTPVYILGNSKDLEWTLILSPTFIGWVPSDSTANVSDTFVEQWQKTASSHLTAITRTKTPVISATGRYLLTAYVGSVFPYSSVDHSRLRLLVPVKGKNNQAIIRYASVSDDSAVVMPLAATPAHFASLIKTLIHRPYGWGNLNFDNDCSSELKSLFTPFGIWLPRHSGYQVNAGKLVDKTALDMDGRMEYLRKNGHPLMTIVYIGGHIFLYLGNNDKRIMTYQDMWALSPAPRIRRAVVGESVIFPLLKQYPEDPALNSPANLKYFRVSYLDQFPKSKRTPLLRSLVQ